MKHPEHQQWPDGASVRFTDEARKAMQQRPGVMNPLPAPALGSDIVYTINNTDDSLHDVILREAGERYGIYWLTEAEPGQPSENMMQTPGRPHETYPDAHSALINNDRKIDFAPDSPDADHTLLDNFFNRELPISFDQDRGTPRHSPEAKLETDQRPRHRGNWMQTYTGRQFYPLDPRPDDIDILDIAHALSMQCRYNGHVREFMSVAEHCVLISRLVSPENALWALLHDATEAYVGDMVRPLKLHMSEYRAVEDKVMLAIAERFRIESLMPAEVKTADLRILLDERAALFGEPAGDWQIDGEPFGVRIPAWGPAEAEFEYLLRFAELTGNSAGLSLSVGLCSNRADHDPHVHRSASLGALWCSADQDARLPRAAEHRQRR